MATNQKLMFRGAAATSNTTLYTVPAATSAIVTDIVVANTAASAGTFTLSIDGVVIAPTVSIAANTLVSLEIKQVMNASTSIQGYASATTINFHISGVERA